jgi:hypothetical protein
VCKNSSYRHGTNGGWEKVNYHNGGAECYRDSVRRGQGMDESGKVCVGFDDWLLVVGVFFLYLQDVGAVLRE